MNKTIEAIKDIRTLCTSVFALDSTTRDSRQGGSDFTIPCYDKILT